LLKGNQIGIVPLQTDLNGANERLAMPHDIFISHVEEDSAIAIELAGAFEQAGFRSWYYERDCLPGPHYLLQVPAAIDEASVLVVIISPHSLSSHQVTSEVVRAYEAGKSFVPLLLGITHSEFQLRQPVWRQALGASTSLALPPSGVAGVFSRIIAGVRALLASRTGSATDPMQAQATTGGLANAGPSRVKSSISLQKPELRHFTWERSQEHPGLTFAQPIPFLDERNIRISRRSSRTGDQLLYDTESVCLMNISSNTYSRIMNCERVEGAAVSSGGRFVTVSLGTTIAIVDLKEGLMRHTKRDLEVDRQWQDVHANTLRDPYYLEGAPEFIYTDVAVSEESGLFAGSRIHYMADSRGGYSYSEGFESVDVFLIETGEFLYPLDFMSPGALSFDSAGSSLLFESCGAGLTAFDLERRKPKWRHWLDDNVNLLDKPCVEGREVLAACWMNGSGMLGYFKTSSGRPVSENAPGRSWRDYPMETRLFGGLDLCKESIVYSTRQDKTQQSEVTILSSQDFTCKMKVEINAKIGSTRWASDQSLLLTGAFKHGRHAMARLVPQ
jgi:TIR domain